jgi:hypothetical protein
VEVKIGVSDSPRELVVSSGQTPDEVAELVDGALSGSSGTLSLTDDKGRRYLIPSTRIAYVEIAPSEVRRVGFGVGSS